MTSYSQELKGLAATYSSSREMPDDDAIGRIRSILSSRNVYFVGSGGTFAVAELAADLHHDRTANFAMAVTPLRLVESVDRTSNAAVVILSARARHPDTAFAASHAIAMGLPLVLVTQKAAHELGGPLASSRASILTLPNGGVSDGFLATNSVLSMATAIARIYTAETLPAELSVPELADNAAFRERVLVLYGQQGRPAAHDIETRLHELGLADVQLADYRNFAHGRHVGLHRRGSTTTVLALIDPGVRQLARRTLSILPGAFDIRVLETFASEPAAALELLVGVMPIASVLGSQQSIEPSKPSVADFGRALYHLPFKKMYPVVSDSPPQRKARACGLSPSDTTVSVFSDAYREWVEVANRTAIGALVLDYDGTCVRTADRYELPELQVQESLLRVLELDLPVVFATGRGDSIYRDLRQWVPKTKWPMVSLALHNGAWLQELAHDLIEPKVTDEMAATVTAALQPLVRAGVASVRSSHNQVSVQSMGAIRVGGLRTMVSSILASVGQFTVASSAHSVDVIDRRFGKAFVLATAEERFGTVLAVGDQGAEGGNDYDLLAATTLSVSVDTCSTDLSRCWNVTDSSIAGPDALVSLLSRLVSHRGTPRLKLKKPPPSK